MKQKRKTGGERAAPSPEETALERRYGFLAAVLELLAGLAMVVTGAVTRFALGNVLDDAEDIYASAADPGTVLGGMTPDRVRLFMAVAVVILVLGLAVTAAGVVSLVRRRRILAQKD